MGGGGIATDCTLHPKEDTLSFETRMLKGKNITCYFVPYVSLLQSFKHFVKKLLPKLGPNVDISLTIAIASFRGPPVRARGEPGNEATIAIF